MKTKRIESLRNYQAKFLDLLAKAIELDKTCIDWAKFNEKFDNIRNLKEYKVLFGEGGSNIR